MKFLIFLFLAISIVSNHQTKAVECKDENAEDRGEGCVCKKDYIVKHGKCVINPAICYLVTQALDDLESTTTGFWTVQKTPITSIFQPRAAGVGPQDLIQSELDKESPKKKMSQLRKLVMMASMFREDILVQCGYVCGCDMASKFLFSS